MSGSNQHFIPQSLLRGFGVMKKKATYVVAYTYNRGVFNPPTQGIAAERTFYSELSVDGQEETLDDRITKYETPLGQVLRDLRNLPSGAVANSYVAAELVTHLAVRNDHLRKSIGTSAASSLEQIENDFSDPTRAMKMLGLDGTQATGAFAAELEIAVTRFASLIPCTSREKLRDVLFAYAKKNFAPAYEETKHEFANLLLSVQNEIPQIIADSQRKILADQLAPKARIEQLARYRWQVLEPKGLLVMPDCTSIAINRAGDASPLMLAEIEQSKMVLMPISSERLLQGSIVDHPVLPDRLNHMLVSCAWDFFVARDRTDELAALRPKLRTRSRAILDEAVREARGDI